MLVVAGVVKVFLRLAVVAEPGAEVLVAMALVAALVVPPILAGVVEDANIVPLAPEVPAAQAS